MFPLIYIPLWFYSNCLMLALIIKCIVFTFHYGSILINIHVLCAVRHCRIYIPLWFYSNSLSTALCSKIFWIYIPLWFYSNQQTTYRNSLMKYIYIPLWFYSNCFWCLPIRDSPDLHSTMVLF